jgi:hypothetical protein
VAEQILDDGPHDLWIEHVNGDLGDNRVKNLRVVRAPIRVPPSGCRCARSWPLALGGPHTPYCRHRVALGRSLDAAPPGGQG